MLVKNHTPDEADKAKQAIADFRVFNVGLWAFDSKSGIINKIYNPKKDKPLSELHIRRRYRYSGINLQLCPPLKKNQPFLKRFQMAVIGFRIQSLAGLN